MRKYTLINLFHPDIDQSRGNRVLLDQIRDLPDLTIRDMYREYPDFKIDVKREQQLLLDFDLIVFQHPFYWYSAPALMKEWQDKVLEMGFAYPPGVGDRLKGRDWLSAITTGGAQEAYCSGGFNNYSMSELLKPFQQTANLCGMIWHRPFVVHRVLPDGINGYPNIAAEELTKRAEAYRAYLKQLINQQ